MPRAARLAAVVSLFAGLASVAHAEIEFIVDSRLDTPAARRLFTEARKPEVHFRTFDPEQIVDPIAKGRFLAELQASEFVVVVGLDAGGWVAKELEGVPVYFAGCLPEARGADLQSEGWSGSMPYSAGQILDLAGAAGWKTLDLAFTPGYSSLLAEVRTAAAGRNIRLVEHPVELLSRIPSATAHLDAVDALWLLGDPLLMRGPGFDHILEMSLASNKPIIAPEASMVGHGAFVAVEPDWNQVLRRAATVAQAGTPPAPHLAFSADAGVPVSNEVLERKWKITIPKVTR